MGFFYLKSHPVTLNTVLDRTFVCTDCAGVSVFISLIFYESVTVLVSPIQLDWTWHFFGFQLSYSAVLLFSRWYKQEKVVHEATKQPIQ